jgi:hypothetical protein
MFFWSESLNRSIQCSIYFRYILDGVPRMRERPIGDLVSGLKQLGADVDCFLGTNCPPVRIVGKGGLPGGKVRLPLVFILCRVDNLSVLVCLYHIHWHRLVLFHSCHFLFIFAFLYPHGHISL